MDERRLTELFQAGAQSEDVPPATFSHADVVAASRAQTHRRRQLAAGGVALGVVALLGGGIAVSQLGGQQSQANSTAASAGSDERAAADAAAPAAAAPPAGAATGCVTPDAELAAAVADVLPAAAGATPQPVPSPCPAGSHAVQLAVTDAGRSDVLRVVVGPSSGSLLPDSAVSRTVRTASGASLTVSALDGVLTDQLDAVAQALAARF